VLEAEKYYFELTTEMLRNARIQILSRGFVWLVEVLPGKWEQYSDKIIRQIEDAQSTNLPHVCNTLLVIRLYGLYLRLNLQTKNWNDVELFSQVWKNNIKHENEKCVVNVSIPHSLM